jgi:hypothetical protein
MLKNRIGVFTFQLAPDSSTDPALRCYSLRLKKKIPDNLLGDPIAAEMLLDKLNSLPRQSAP